MRSLVVAALALSTWLVCCGADIEQAPQLADCLDTRACGLGQSPGSPLGRNFPQPDGGAGADAGVSEGGIPQGTIPEAGAGPGISGITGASTPPGSAGELGP